MNQRILELQKILKAASAAYYSTGISPIEDALYDKLESELRSLDPKNDFLTKIGSSENMLAKTKHEIPMGSLNKAMNESELRAWLSRHQGNRFFATFKMDGGSVSLQYHKGKLVKAVTRGDGIEGDDITHNAIHFYGVPKKGVKFHGNPFSGFVRGEIILTNDKWLIADPEQSSNPRNMAVGIARRKSDQSEANLITVYAFRAHFEDGTELSHTEMAMHDLLKEAGFTVPDEAILSSDANAIWKYVLDIEKIRSTLNYWIDGIVVTINDLHVQKEFSVEPKPEWSIAVKFAPRAVETVLLGVEFNVGHTGAIVPVGKFAPRFIDGTEVKSALLCNWDVINALDIAIGDTVRIYKAGDIIPRVLDVVHRPANRVIIAEPTKCPVCGGPVGRKQGVGGNDSAGIFCLNDDCEAKVFGKLKRYTRSLEIMWLGDEVLHALIENAGVKSPADLYTLEVGELAKLRMVGTDRVLGNTTAKKIIAEIEKTLKLTLPQLLGSIGIESLGKGRVENIMEAVPGELDSIEDWRSGKLRNKGFAARAGVPNLGSVIQDSIDKKWTTIEALGGCITLISLEKKELAADAKSFCLTGTLSKGRNEIVKDIEAAGHVFADVSSNLDYLVMEDPTSDSSKAKKARKLGVKCISETELYNILSK
jgi:DNA ligase (NAD+)